MLDFTSALYLGLRHGSDVLLPWPSLTSGRPAVLGELPGTEAVARALAALQGCERTILATSTLHIFWDLFTGLGPGHISIYVNDETYPVARWGVERAAGRGALVRTFAHHDAADLARRLRADAGRGRRPVVVADGFCPSCGRAAPLTDYLAATRRYGGRLVIDDSQALGIFGSDAAPGVSYGLGGGGSLRHAGIRSAETMVVASLAKGLGAPIAATSGAAQAIQMFAARSETRMHASPPSAAAIHAAAHALAVNRTGGDSLRLRLWRLIETFRSCLRRAGLAAQGGIFPVQTIGAIAGSEALRAHDRLLEAGVRTVLWHPHGAAAPLIAFIITVMHSVEQIERAVSTLRRAIAPRQRPDRSFAQLPAVMGTGR